MRPLVALTLGTLLLASVASAQDGKAAKDPRNLTWVTEGVLAIGGGGLNESEVDWLHASGFRAIADFRAEHDDPADHIASRGMAFLDMPIDSASDINATQLRTFVSWAREQQEAGRPIYIHCTNGWHRAAAFAVGWEMVEHGESYDEAAKEAAKRRPGTVMRAVSGLLDLQAEVQGTPQLAVVLVSPLTRPEPNMTMPAHVDVFADGAPAANAKVRVWSEESRLRIEGVTDASGRFTFSYTAPSSTFMDHLYARASLEGHADGADNIEIYFQQPAKQRGPLDVEVTRDGADVLVRVRSEDRPIAARVVATAPGWTAFESSKEGVVRFPDAPTDAIEVRAVSWGSEGGLARVDAPPAPPLPEPVPPPAPEPEPQPPAQADPPAPPEPAPPAEEIVVPPPEAGDGRAHALTYAAAGLAGAVALGLYVIAARRRGGVGRT